MLKFKFLLIAVAIVGISSLFSCKGGTGEESTKDSTSVSAEQTTPEEEVDSLAKADPSKK